MPVISSAAQIVSSLKPGMTVYVPGVSGESLAFYSALKDNPTAAAGVRFVGMHFPGINRSDYIGLHKDARQRSYFMTPGLRAGLDDGRAELVPLDHPAIFRDLAENVEIDLAVAQLTPPDSDGYCSPGLAYDFLPAIWAKAKRRVAHINPALPRTQGSFQIHQSTLEAVFEQNHELVEYDSGAFNATTAKHASLVASLVRDGDTLEFGVGKLQASILSSLHGHRNLRVWSGMVSTPIVPLLDSGVIRCPRSIVAGVALGNRSFYERVRRDEAFYFRSVCETHDVRRMAQIRNFCAINSAVEVDLFGQTNADVTNGKLIAGVGGLPAFVQGAHLCSNGRSIIALPASTDDNSISRIKAQLGTNALTALPRHLADYVVTEHGIASLRGLTIHARAKALIAIAAPQFREELSSSWHEISRRL